jgi:hypothetical protein
MWIGWRQPRSRFAHPAAVSPPTGNGQAGYFGIVYRLALFKVPAPLPMLGVAVAFYLF